MAGGGTEFVNRIGSVANLMQAETINAGTINAQVQLAPLPSRVPLHASLRRIDRVPQLEQLTDAVEDARFQARAKPLVVIIDGRPEDEMLGFVQRLQDHDFDSEMRLPCDYLGHFDWPEMSINRTIRQLSSAIIEARGKPVPPLAQARDELVELIGTHNRSLAFTHVVDSGTCKPELLSAWEELIAGACRNPTGGLLVCFLCVQKTERPRRGMAWLASRLGLGRNEADGDGEQPSWLETELEAMAERHGWCRVNPLTPLEFKHLNEWVEEYNTRPALPDLPHIDTRLPRDVFQDRDSLRYREAVERVLRLLAPLLRPEQPRWN